MAKCISWYLIFLVMVVQIQRGNGSNQTPTSEVIELRVGVPKKDGFPQFVNVVWDPRQQNYNVSGYCMDVFNAVLTRLPFHVSLHVQPYVIESTDISGTYDALLHQIPTRYDVVVGDVTILANRSNFVDFTLPYTGSGVKMVVPVRHGRQQTMWIFVKPFSWDLWLSIIIVSTFIGVAILIMERNVKVLPNQDGSTNPTKLNPATILWFPISQAILPERFSGHVVAKNCSRFVLMVWLLLAFVLMQSYTANLTSILTLDQLRPSFLNVNDLRKGGYYVGYQTGSFVYDVLVEQFKFEPSKLRPYSNTFDYHHALKLGSEGGGVAAIFDELPYLKVFLQEYGSNYILSGPRYRNDGFGFAFRFNSNLTAYFSRAILNVTESYNLMNEIEEKYFGKSNDSDDVGVEEASGEMSSNTTLSLTFHSFAGLFLITGISTLIALLVSETVIWQKPILMAKAYSQRYLFSAPSSPQTETGNGSNNATSKSGVIKLRVGVPQKYGFPQLVDVDLLVSDSGKEKQQASGYCIDVFNAVVERLNLPYKVSLHFKYYVIDSNSSTTYDSVLHKIPKELDMVVGDITIRASRSEFLDFTVPYASSGVRMVVSVQHGKRQTMWIFVKPFNWALWFSIIIFSTFVGLSILFMERNVKVLPNQHGFPNPVKLNPATILWFPISQAILPERQVVAKNCSRFVLMVWILLTLVLMQSYTANLTSILTLDQLRPSFLNVDDLSKGGYYVGYQAGSFVKDMLIQQFKFDPSKLRAYSNISEYYDALNIGSQGGGVAAIFDELLFLKVFLQQFGSKYVMTGPIYKTNGFGFAFPLNSSLTAYFSRAILNVTESDLMNQIEEKYFEMNNGLGGREEQYAEKSQSLNFYSFSGLFLITGIATLLALLISETTFIWQRLILMAKAFSQRYLFPSPPSVETRVHPTHDSTTQNTENRNHLTRPPPEFLTDGN